MAVCGFFPVGKHHRGASAGAASPARDDRCGPRGHLGEPLHDLSLAGCGRRPGRSIQLLGEPRASRSCPTTTASRVRSGSRRTPPDNALGVILRVFRRRKGWVFVGIDGLRSLWGESNSQTKEQFEISKHVDLRNEAVLQTCLTDPGTNKLPRLSLEAVPGACAHVGEH